MNRQFVAITVLATVLLSATACQFTASGKNAEGVRLYEQGQTQAAVQQFQQALTNDPANSDAYYNLAAAYHQLGKSRSDSRLLEESEDLYHRCLDLSPNSEDCYRGLAALLVDTQRPESAFTLLEKWSERSPNLSDPHVELARLHEEFGDNEQARGYLEKAVAVNPNDSRAWTALGQLREEQGRYAQALTNYQRAYNLNRGQPGLARRISSLQQNLARSNELGRATRTVQAPENVRSPLQ